jgi:hypothetical protein
MDMDMDMDIGMDVGVVGVVGVVGIPPSSAKAACRASTANRQTPAVKRLAPHAWFLPVNPPCARLIAESSRSGQKF